MIYFCGLVFVPEGALQHRVMVNKLVSLDQPLGVPRFSVL